MKMISEVFDEISNHGLGELCQNLKECEWNLSNPNFFILL